MIEITKPTFRPDIEGLRATAVLLVLFYHAGLPLAGGYIGVDIFFVISGFLITGLLLREAENTGHISLINFYARRAKRLLPAASVVLIAIAGFSYFFSPPTHRAAFGLDVVAAAAYFANWRFADRSVDYLAEDLGQSPALHFWSLSVEEQFYFIWPLLIILALHFALRSNKEIRSIATITLSLILASSFAWSILHTKSNPEEAFFLTTTRLWELSVGAMLSVLLPQIKKLPSSLANFFGWCGALLIIISALLFNNKTSWPSFYALAPTIGAALVIGAGTLTNSTPISQLLATKPMVWIGGLSYSMYLWHWPILIFAQSWFNLEGPLWGGTLVAMSLIPAWLSYHLIEQPIRTSQKLLARPYLILCLGAGLTSITIFAGFTVNTAFNISGVNQNDTDIKLSTWRGSVLAQPMHFGAGALGRQPTLSKEGIPRAIYSAVTPHPMNATKDIPRAYTEGCQAPASGTIPSWCVIGDVNSSRIVAVLGDSKILQYYEALDAAGKALNWKIVTATKSACTLTAAVTLRKGRPYTECLKFTNNVMRDLGKFRPYAVITSQAMFKGHMPDAQSSTPTRKGMIQGLVAIWSQFDSWGSKVFVVLDNPKPNSSVYNCLLANPEDALKCTFQKVDGKNKSAEKVQRLAAQQINGISIIDLSDYICPREICAPVIGDVLVYRQGPHITNTYARSLSPVLTAKLHTADVEYSRKLQAQNQ